MGFRQASPGVKWRGYTYRGKGVDRHKQAGFQAPAGTQKVVPCVSALATTEILTVPQSPWSTAGPRLSLIPSQLFSDSKPRSGDR